MNHVTPVLRRRSVEGLADQLAAAALEAGVLVMRFYRQGCAARVKPDRSPVTEADEAAEALILTALDSILPGVPVVAEESAAKGGLPQIGREFLLVDALDGTLEFIKRNGEFTVNVALVSDGTPVCGVVFAPALGRMWIGAEGATVLDVGPDGRLPEAERRRPVRARPRPATGMVALASRSHFDSRTEAFLSTLPIASRREGGSSVKFCLLAEGEADVYARFGLTMEWDTAAGDAVLRAAGGMVEDLQGAPLRYGKQASGYRNSGFVAWGAPPAK